MPHTRRAFTLSALALAGTGLAAPAMADQAPLADADLSLFDAKAVKHLAKANRIAVPTYRLGVVMRSGISASGSSGSVTTDTSVELRGVSHELLRSIADRAYADFIKRLGATGRPIVPIEDIRTAQGYGQLEMASPPFGKKPFADARYAVLTAPNGMDLFFTHFDAPLSDQSPLALGNWRALNQLSVDLGSVILIPTVVVDFAELSGSGHKVYSNSASVQVKPGLYAVELFTALSAYHAKIRIAGELGRATLQKRIAIGQAGEFVKTSQTDNHAEVAWWNSQVNSGSVAPGTIGPSLAYDSSTYEYRVDPAVFADIVFDGASAINGAYAQAAATYRPAG